MRLAAQLYTLRDFTKTREGFEDALRRCAEIGYEGVQLSAVGCMTGENALGPEDAKGLLDRYGLVCAATHRPWSSLQKETDREIEFHKILDCDYVAVGSIQGDFGESPEAYMRFVAEAEPVASRLREHGIRFGYHNHSHEFARDPATSRWCFEPVLKATWLQLEVDTYWVAHAGVCPEAFLGHCSGRIAAVHLKDMEVVPGEGPVMAPVGEGNLDWGAILGACRTAGTEWLIVEQDTFRRDPYDCLASSYGYLRSLLD